MINNSLLNWCGLKAYFQCCAIEAATWDAQVKARFCFECLGDDIVFLYLMFASPIIFEFEKLNATFQATTADPEKLMKELDMHHQSLRKRLFDANGLSLSLCRVDMGSKFSS